MGTACSIAHSTAPLTAAGLTSVFLSDVFMAGAPGQPTTIQKQFDGRNLLKGAINGDQDCTVDIYQALDPTDIANVTKAFPAVGVNDGILFHQKLLFVGAALGDGTPLNFVLQWPWVIVRVTNTSGVLMTKFRFHLDAVA